MSPCCESTPSSLCSQEVQVCNYEKECAQRCARRGNGLSLLTKQQGQKVPGADA
jgi:hypothetical protein